MFGGFFLFVCFYTDFFGRNPWLHLGKKKAVSVLFPWQQNLENISPLTAIKLVPWKGVPLIPAPFWKLWAVAQKTEVLFFSLGSCSLGKNFKNHTGAQQKTLCGHTLSGINTLGSTIPPCDIFFFMFMELVFVTSHTFALELWLVIISRSLSVYSECNNSLRVQQNYHLDNCPLTHCFTPLSSFQPLS